MTDWTPSNEGALRIIIFLAVFVLMAIWEVLAARRELRVAKGQRWVNNLGLVILDTFVVRLLFPVAAVGVAIAASEFDWGLFHQLDPPFWLAVVLSIVLLDLAIYLQHVMFHAVPALWRLHMVHHADVDFDVTTGIRFHPIEIVLSMLIKLSIVGTLGVPVLGVLLFDVLLNASSLFNHSNVRIPLGFERYLRWLVVTPDMHRVHHSVEDAEHTTNFGFNLSWWDRLLGTYLAQPAAGHEGMTIGLPSFRGAQWRSLPRMLAMPFDRRAAVSTRRAAKESREKKAE